MQKHYLVCYVLPCILDRLEDEPGSPTLRSEGGVVQHKNRQIWQWTICGKTIFLTHANAAWACLSLQATIDDFPLSQVTKLMPSSQFWVFAILGNSSSLPSLINGMQGPLKLPCGAFFNFDTMPVTSETTVSSHVV